MSMLARIIHASVCGDARSGACGGRARSTLRQRRIPDASSLKSALARIGCCLLRIMTAARESSGLGRTRQYSVVVAAWGVLSLAGTEVRAVEKPPLQRAQELFQRNHWEEARAVVRQQASAMPARERAVASFLVGRSYVREAELYHAWHRAQCEIDRAYLTELGEQKANRGNVTITLFNGFAALGAGDAREAQRLLALALAPKARLPQEWKTVAQTRRSLALAMQGDVPAMQALNRDASIEALALRLLLKGERPASVPALAPSAGRREKLLAACLLYRSGRGAEAERLLAGSI
jgi:hypothetical protein